MSTATRMVKWTAIAFATLFVALVLFVLFGTNTLRGPISNAVTKATGRELLIQGDLKPVWSWVHPRFRAEQVSFANADWGEAEHLFKADAIEVAVSVFPLLRGRVVVPELHLERPDVNLEQDAEGRKNWVLGNPEEQKQESRVFIRQLTLDEGRLAYSDAVRDIGLEAGLSTGEGGVSFRVEGSYRGNDVIAKGQGGPILSIRGETTPYPIKAEAKVGDTQARIDGTITGLVSLAGFDLSIELSGKTMEDLYDIVNIALPATSPYRTAGRLIRDGTVIRYENFTGKVGESDLAGTLQVDTGADERPFMQGDLVSKKLNLADLGPLVGTNAPREKQGAGVLPDAPFDASRWDSVDADVKIKAGSIERPEQLPIENLGTRIQMTDRVLTLDPLEFGIAGGKLAGTVKLDGSRDEPIRADLKMRVHKLALNRMFPTIEASRASIGSVGGTIELTGTGNSVGRMLASSNGKIGLFVDSGQVSRFLMELVALDLWDVARVKLKGDEPIDLRCAIADFGVKNGVMNTNALVFDTTVVNVSGTGQINLKNEAMDLKLTPAPKDKSLVRLSTPLYIRGTFSDPKVAPDATKLTVQALGAAVAAIINPLLAVIPLVDEEHGKDSNCARLIAEVTSNRSTATGSTQPAGK